MSGSGKSVALHALEDAGYYCVDNLPPELLLPFVELEQKSERAARRHRRRRAQRHLAAAGAGAAAGTARPQDVRVRPLFLDATTDTLVRRFSETRRRHPLSGNRPSAEARRRRPTIGQHALVDAIELERELLADLREQAHVIDTSVIRPTQLQAHVKSLLSAPISQLTLVFESFAFKRGIPVDADYVFDVRMLPNPHYEPALRDLTGRDAAGDRLPASSTPTWSRCTATSSSSSNHWLEPLARDHRSYVTVAIGCTGGPAPVGLPGRAAGRRLRQALDHAQAPPRARRRLMRRRSQRSRLPAGGAPAPASPSRGRSSAPNQPPCGCFIACRSTCAATGCRCRSLCVSTCTKRRRHRAAAAARAAAPRPAAHRGFRKPAGSTARPRCRWRAAFPATPSRRRRGPATATATARCA